MEAFFSVTLSDFARIIGREGRPEQETTMEQCDILKAKMTFTYVNPDTNRQRVVKQGQLFWVTTTKVWMDREGTAGVAPKGKSMGDQVMFPLNMVADLFEVLPR
jgi:hypothetical protein